MARFLQPAARRTLLLSHSSSSTLSQVSRPVKTLTRPLSPPPPPTSSPSFSRSRNYIAEMRQSAFKENILRILRTEIDYEIDVRPPKEPVKEYKDFKVEDRPGEQWIRLRRKHGEKEEIKVEVTMFDGAIAVPPDTAKKIAEESGGDCMKLHISLIVDVMKNETPCNLQFVCSAWPDALEIESMFIVPLDPVPAVPYVGPKFKEMDEELQDALQQFLEDRGLDEEFGTFLHQYMSNKDRTEFVRWMGNVKSYLEK